MPDPPGLRTSALRPPGEERRTKKKAGTFRASRDPVYVHVYYP